MKNAAPLIRGLGVLVCVAVGLMSVIACSSGASDKSIKSLINPSMTEPPADAEVGAPTSDICRGKNLRIGVDTYGSGFPFGKDVISGMQELDRKIDCVELIILENNTKPEGVLNNTRSLVSQRVDGLISMSGVPATVNEVTDMALNAGIPLVTAVLPSSKAPFVDVDFAADATLAGETFAEEFKVRFPNTEPYVIVGNYPDAGPPATDRITFAVQAIRAAFPGLPEDHVLTFDTKADPGHSSQTVTALTARIPRGAPVLLIGWTDDMGYPMMQAAINAGHPTLAFGYGGDASGRPFVCNGFNILSWFPEKQIDYLLPAVVALVNGDKLPEHVVIPGAIITSENLTEFYPDEAC